VAAPSYRFLLAVLAVLVGGAAYVAVPTVDRAADPVVSRSLAAGGGLPGDGGAMSMDDEAPAPHWMRLLVRVGWVLSVELPLLALILLWRRRRELEGIALRGFTILMLAGVAITHASDWLDKLQEATYIAVGFGLLIVGSGVLALAVASWQRHTRRVDIAGGWMSGLTIVAYVWSRAIGLPEIPDHVGHWADAWGTASLVVEAALVAVALRPHRRLARDQA
jgi:hypothetical protein